MNIDDLTIKQVREIGALLNVGTGTATATEKSPFVGRHVICRCYSAGVHAGILVSQCGDMVHLKESRRLWSWKVKGEGVALSGVAQNGLAVGSKIDAVNPDIVLTGVIETIPTSTASRESIDEFQQSS